MAVPPITPAPHALNPNRGKIKIPRSLMPDVPPDGLELGELAVELASTPPRLWCGWPGVGANGRVQINAGGGMAIWRGAAPPADPAAFPLWWDITGAQLYVWSGVEWVVAVNPPGVDDTPTMPEPQDPGNFLRTNIGTWVPGLPLNGGIVTGPLTLDIPLPIASGGTNATTAALALDSLSAASGGTAGALVRSSGGGWSIGAAGIPEPGTAGNFLRSNTGTWVAGLPLSGGILSGILTANGGIILGGGIPSVVGFHVAGSWDAQFDNYVRIGTPTGPAASGVGNINISGQYFRNGVAIGAGIAEPSTVGNFLRTNTGTWVAGLPLSGGTLLDRASGGAGLTLSNGASDGNYALNILVPASNGWGGGLRFNMQGTGFSNGMYFINNSAGLGIAIENLGAGRGLNMWNPGSGTLFNLMNHGGGSGDATAGNGIVLTSNTPHAAGAFQINIFGGGGLDINNEGTAYGLRIRNGVTNHFSVTAGGTVTMSPAMVASMRTALGI